jgi:aspartate aminotransferase
VTLGAGTYRDDKGNPWVLPSFQVANERLNAGGDHEYLAFFGSARFLGHASRLVFGNARQTDSIASVQTIGGSGAVHLAAVFLKAFGRRPETVLIPNQSWENHRGMFAYAGYAVREYGYYNMATRAFDLAAMQADLLAAPDRSIVVLHACGHNPTGCDPSAEEWAKLASIFEQKQLFAFFDNAYQGFVSGNFAEDRA